MCEFCKVWVCVGVGFILCVCEYVFVCVWNCNVWVCVCLGFVMCGCVHVLVL